jgi:hypothetical protein
MKNTKNITRKKKESFVVFEDWMRYARCFNDAEFRQFITNILNYYKGIEPVLNTPNLQEVWNDIIDDLSINVTKKQAKRDTMLRNAVSNPKLNTVLNIKPDIRPDIRPDTRPDTEPDTEPSTILNTAGMVDGRCETGDEKMNDEKMGDEKKQMMWDDDDEILEPYSSSLVTQLLSQGKTYESVKLMYPGYSSEITDIFLDNL